MKVLTSTKPKILALLVAMTAVASQSNDYYYNDEGGDYQDYSNNGYYQEEGNNMFTDYADGKEQKSLGG